jgi:hypothetical protein
MPLPRRPIGAGGVVLSPMREPEPAGRSKRRLRPPPRRPDEPAAAHANDLVDARNGTMVQAADMLIEESQRLLQEEEYDKALATLDQASVVAPHDGSIHLMKALSRCKAAMAEIEQLQLLSGPEWGEFALHSRRVAVDAGIQLELDAARHGVVVGGGSRAVPATAVPCAASRREDRQDGGEPQRPARVGAQAVRDGGPSACGAAGRAAGLR